MYLLGGFVKLSKHNTHTYKHALRDICLRHNNFALKLLIQPAYNMLHCTSVNKNTNNFSLFEQLKNIIFVFG